MTRVKILASVLACLILMHGACMARCLGEGSQGVRQTEVPPCHHPQGTPDQSNAPMPTNTCAGGPALEAKSFPILKCALAISVPHSVIEVPIATMQIAMDDKHNGWRPVEPPLLLHSVLRI